MTMSFSPDHKLPSPANPIEWTAGPGIDDDETALLIKAQAGDKDAFADLVSNHVGTLYRLVLRITKNREDAEDALQEAILKAYSNLPGFQRRARFRTWIARIAINAALARLHRHRLMKEVPLEELRQSNECADPSSDLVQSPEDPEVLYARREVSDLMMKAIGRLVPTYHSVFTLTHLEGCTTQETAKELELSTVAVRVRLHRARKQLRSELHGINATSLC